MWSALVLIVGYFIVSVADGAMLPKCDSGGVRCGNGTCIDMKLLCDGVSQCPRGEDERDCEKSCSSGYYQCYSSSCIPNYLVCDGRVDCYYGDDEENCGHGITTTRNPITTTDSCSSNQFQCNSGYCIPASYVCDGYNDCTFGEDENGCQTHSTITSSTSTKPTSPWYTTTRCNGFQCWNGECIPWYYVCNGYYDCYNGEDEAQCTTTRVYTTPSSCDGSHFQCWSGNCISNTWICDSECDCSQCEDEYDCYATTPTPGVSHPTSTVKPLSCNNPFDLVGDRCIFVDPVTDATWNEARYVCERFGGDLVILDSPDFFGDIIRYINEKGLTARDYWVGGTNSGGKWKWLNGADITMGTPFWAIYGTGSSIYEQEPRGSNNLNMVPGISEDHSSTDTPQPGSDSCTYLDKTRFYYIDDIDCDEMKAFICQVPNWKVSAVSSSGIPAVEEIGEERLKEILEASKLEKPE